MVVLTEKFRFIRDDVFLCPWVDSKTGKQKLIMQKINLETNEVEFKDQIDCIHTAITNISTTEFENYQNDADSQENLDRKTLNIRSSEKLRKINLTPKEKFKALTSWVAGIAEAGLNAFRIQDEIDKNLGLLYPISQFLLRFMVKADREFLPEYITKIERDCMFEGTRHESSFIANSFPILEIMWINYIKNNVVIGSEDEEIIKNLISLDISGNLFKSDPKFSILKEEINNKLNESEKIKKLIPYFNALIETIWINNFDSTFEEEGILNETDQKIILGIHKFNPPIEFYESNPTFLYIIGYIDVETLTKFLLKIEQTLEFEHLERLFTKIFKNFIDVDQSINFDEFYPIGEKNLALAFSKLNKIPDLLLKNNNFIDCFLMDKPELVRNIIIICLKNQNSEYLNEILFLFLNKIFKRFEDMKQDQKEGGPIYVNSSRERDDFFIKNVTTRYGENIYDIFTNIDPFKLITNFSEYLFLLTEFKPEAILYFVANISKSSMFKSNPKKCIQNLADTFLNILSKEINVWYFYDNNFKNLPSLVTRGEKKLLKSILDLNNDFDIKNLNQSTIYLLISIYPEYSSKLLKNLKIRCIKNDKLDKNEIIKGILPYIETITNIIIDALRDNEIINKYTEYRQYADTYYDFINEADMNLITNILSIDPPLELIDENIRFLDILAMGDRNIISKYLTKINNDYSKNEKSILLNDLIQIILENDNLYYILDDYGWQNRRDIYLKEIFKMNPPIEIFQKSNKSAKLLNSIHAENYNKNNIKN